MHVLDILRTEERPDSQRHSQPSLPSLLLSRALCREKATEWIDAGASIVIGSGPHHVLDHELIHGHPVFYSVGNLLFDGGGSDREWSRGAMVELTITFPDSLVRAQIIDPLGGASPGLSNNRQARSDQ